MEGASLAPLQPTDWMVEIEVLLARSLGWSLYDIDMTDAAHLLNFIMHLTEQGNGRVYAYADEVSWL